MTTENNVSTDCTEGGSVLQYHLTKLRTDGAIIGGAVLSVAITLSALIVLQENWNGLWVVPATVAGLVGFLVPVVMSIRELFRRQRQSEVFSFGNARPFTVFAASLAFGMLLTAGVSKNALQSGMYYQLGQRDLANEDYAAATENFTRYIELAPGHAVGYYKRGLAKYEAGQLEDAYVDLKAAVERQPRDWNSRLLFLGTLERLGRTDELNAELELAERLNPEVRNSLTALLDSVDG